MAGSLSDA
jgi:hypothetical protein